MLKQTPFWYLIVDIPDVLELIERLGALKQTGPRLDHVVANGGPYRVVADAGQKPVQKAVLVHVHGVQLLLDFVHFVVVSGAPRIQLLLRGRHSRVQQLRRWLTWRHDVIVTGHGQPENGLLVKRVVSSAVAGIFRRRLQQINKIDTVFKEMKHMYCRRDIGYLQINSPDLQNFPGLDRLQAEHQGQG